MVEGFGEIDDDDPLTAAEISRDQNKKRVRNGLTITSMAASAVEYSEVSRYRELLVSN